MTDELRIILIEDIDTDAELIQRELKKASIKFSMVRVEDLENFNIQLEKFSPNLILSDFSLPHFNAMEALMARNTLRPDIPFILVTGAQTEEIAVSAIKQGADDYILKSSLVRLPTAVLNALKGVEVKKLQKQAVEQLKIREEKYRNIFENSMVGILRWRLVDGSILELNQKAKEFINFCADDTILKECFLNEDDYDKVLAALHEDGFIENYEFQVKSPHNHSIWLSLSAKIFGEVEAEGVLQNISIVKQNIIDLQKINYELDRFVYHASHDLKSPLKSLMGLISSLKDEDDITVITTYLDYMDKSVFRLDNLVNDLLTLARSNKTEDLISNFYFLKEIEGCLSSIAFSGDTEKIKFYTNVSQDISFYTDAIRLRTVLNNLISNAAKYHRLDQNEPYIKITVAVNDEMAIIEIEDNGEGISSGHLPRIFDMFYRGSRSVEGSGLGLYIVKSFIEILKGKISLVSQVKEGSKFIIEIPNLIRSDS